MRVKAKSNPVRPKTSVQFLAEQQPLPKSFSGGAETGSSGGGTTDGKPDAIVSFLATQVNGGARAPPTCLIVQFFPPDCDPVAPSAICSSVQNLAELLPVLSQSQSNTQPEHLKRTN
jgi:hypothetical protein